MLITTVFDWMVLWFYVRFPGSGQYTNSYAAIKFLWSWKIRWGMQINLINFCRMIPMSLFVDSRGMCSFAMLATVHHLALHTCRLRQSAPAARQLHLGRGRWPWQPSLQLVQWRRPWLMPSRSMIIWPYKLSFEPIRYQLLSLPVFWFTTLLSNLCSQSFSQIPVCLSLVHRYSDNI